LILICESSSLEDFLVESEEVDFRHLSIKEKATELFSTSSSEEELVQIAYKFVRDEKGRKPLHKGRHALLIHCIKKANFLRFLEIGFFFSIREMFLSRSSQETNRLLCSSSKIDRIHNRFPMDVH
jgi:hypothetical protein